MKEQGKLAAAVELGRLGGLKGGPARKKKLSAKRRSEIARHAAEVRWTKAEDTPALRRQIKEGYQAYRNHNYHPVEEFIKELEDEADKGKKTRHRTKRQGR